MKSADPPRPSPLRSFISWILLAIVTVLISFLVAVAAVILYPFDRSRKRVHPFVSLWSKAFVAVCPIMRVRFEGVERLDPNQSYVLVANHQSLVDILVVLRLSHPFKFIAKKELFWIPFLGWSLWFAGYIPLLRGNPQSGRATLDRARTYLKRNVSVLFFPEGTRSQDGEIHDFKVGAFKIAAETEKLLVPIVIDGTADIIEKGSATLKARQEVVVRVGTPRRSKGQNPAQVAQFLDDTRHEMVKMLQALRTGPKNSQ